MFALLHLLTTTPGADIPHVRLAKRHARVRSFIDSSLITNDALFGCASGYGCAKRRANPDGWCGHLALPTTEYYVQLHAVCSVYSRIQNTVFLLGFYQFMPTARHGHPVRRQTEVMSMRPFELRIPSVNVKKTPKVRIVLPRIYTHAYHTLPALVCTVKVRCLHKAKKGEI